MLEHGGNLRAALRQYGGALQDWLDLSSGINPQPYPTPMLAPQVWHRLPEDEPALALAAACYYQAPLMLPVAGTQAAIQTPNAATTIVQLNQLIGDFIFELEATDSKGRKSTQQVIVRLIKRPVI